MWDTGRGERREWEREARKGAGPKGFELGPEVNTAQKGVCN